jgi:hypothetical protein
MSFQSNTKTAPKPHNSDHFAQVREQQLISPLGRDYSEAKLTHGFIANSVGEIVEGVRNYLAVSADALPGLFLYDLGSQFLYQDEHPNFKVYFPKEFTITSDQALRCPWVEVSCLAPHKYAVSFGNGFNGNKELNDSLSSELFNVKRFDFSLGFVSRHPNFRSFSELAAARAIKDTLRTCSIPAEIDKAGVLRLILDENRIKVALDIQCCNDSETNHNRVGELFIIEGASRFSHHPVTLSIIISSDNERLISGTYKTPASDKSLELTGTLIKDCLLNRFGSHSANRLKSLGEVNALIQK